MVCGNGITGITAEFNTNSNPQYFPTIILVVWISKILMREYHKSPLKSEEDNLQSSQ